MPVMRGQYAELLGPGLIMNTFQFRRLPEFYRQVNFVQNSKKAYEDDFRLAGFGPLAEKSEMGTTILDEPLKIGGVRFIHKTYALGFVISQEMRDDAQYPQMLGLARELGTSSYWTQELYGHNVLNNGFSTTYTGRDGLALFSTVHPVQGTGATIGNRPTVDTDISEAAIEAAILAYETQINERGMPIMIRPRTVLVHPSQRMLAARLLRSSGEPGVINQINPLFSENLQIISDPWLTDQDAWFLLAEPQDLENALQFFWREMPDTKTWDDDNADGTFHKIRQRHSVGFKDWRGTYGSPGA